MTRKVLDITKTYVNQYVGEYHYELVLNTKKGYYGFTRIDCNGKRHADQSFKDNKEKAIKEWNRRFDRDYKG